jgi:hypothetical protein
MRYLQRLLLGQVSMYNRIRVAFAMLGQCEYNVDNMVYTQVSALKIKTFQGTYE